jgi:hypothetical protein
VRRGLRTGFQRALTYPPPLQQVFGTAALFPAQLAVRLPFPVLSREWTSWPVGCGGADLNDAY